MWSCVFMQPFDQCGASMVVIGDINHDEYRQQHPADLHTPARPSIPDVVLGCPQTGTGYGATGKFMFMLLNAHGEMENYYTFPDIENEFYYKPELKHNSQNLGFNPNSGSQLGASLTHYPGMCVY
jgi:hypothetical protein